MCITLNQAAHNFYIADTNCLHNKIERQKLLLPGITAGQAMKPPTTYMTSFVDSLKKLYVTKVCQLRPLRLPYDDIIVCVCVQFKGFDVEEMSACTLMLEGTPEVCVYNNAHFALCAIDLVRLFSKTCLFPVLLSKIVTFSKPLYCSVFEFQSPKRVC